MNRVGCCIPGGSFMPQGVNEVSSSAEDILRLKYKAIKESGLDFAEVGVGMINSLDDEQIDRLAGAGVVLPAANSLIQLPVIETDAEKLHEFISGALDKLSRVGCRYVVFGSGRARKIPEGLSDDKTAAALKKLDDFILMCADECRKRGMVFVIEPLNKKETNFINTVADGYSLIKRLGHPDVKLLCDIYHMAQNGEDPRDGAKYADLIVHVHVSETDRSYAGKYAGTEKNQYVLDACTALKDAGYKGAFSCEAGYSDFSSELPKVAEYMIKYIR